MTNKYFKTPFAANGEKADIEELTQIDGTVSYQEGYSPDYAKNQEDVGAKFIERDQMNGLFHEITSNLKQWQEQGLYPYNPGIAYEIGGRCNYNDGSGLKAYISTVTNNGRVPSVNGVTQSGWELNDVKAAMDQFGLFGNTNNPNVIETVDMNNLTKNGFYNVTGTAANTPTGGYCSVIVIANSQTNGLQIAIALSAVNDPLSTYYRRFLNGAWGPWQSLGNKGTNLRSWINLSWNTAYTAPVNGTIWGYGVADGQGQYLAILIDSNQTMTQATAAVNYNALAVYYPVRAGQTVWVTGNVPNNRYSRFYRD